MGIVHHTDPEREYAYDRKSHICKLDKALDEARKRNWTVVDIKSDWKPAAIVPLIRLLDLGPTRTSALT
jgi:hypothetical protein